MDFAKRFFTKTFCEGEEWMNTKKTSGKVQPTAIKLLMSLDPRLRLAITEIPTAHIKVKENF